MSDHLRVYISSTYSDLRNYREAVVSTLRRFNLLPVSLEQFGSDEAPLDASLSAIDSSDIVVLLLAHRLGYVPREGTKSLVELEYEKARDDGKPILVFLLDDNQPWPLSQIDPGKSIERFRRRLLQEQAVSFFTTPEDLAAKAAAAVSQYSRQIEGVPLEPSVTARKGPDITLADVVAELKALRAELSVLQQLAGDTLRTHSPMASSSAKPHEARPAEFLGPSAPFTDPLRCFVIMPYSQKWSVAVERIILETCAEAGLTFQIAKNMEGRFLPSDLWRGITGSGLIVADLSGANPNVTYEIGLADVLGKEVVLIAQQANVPFDFLAQRIILYEDSLPGSLTLREELASRLKKYKLSLEAPE